MRLGLHTSISKSLERAALQAVEAGANTFQIFSASPRMWRASPPAESEIKLLARARERHDLYPLVIHDNYLINLASCTESLRQQSTQAFRGEIERALAIGAEYLVAHPGNCRGHSVEQGIYSVIRSLAEAAQGLNTAPLTVLLENTAGAGAALGSRLQELAAMRQFAAELTDLKIGFCIDTCHLLVSGFDISNQIGVETTIAEVDRILGWDNIPVIHTNDSKSPLGSHVDRHENIGKGYIGEQGFRGILTHPLLRSKAFILETPHDDPADERRNIEMLKRLSRLRRDVRGITGRASNARDSGNRR
ncbi:MAG TPA: deoxyribonuclease IV [Bryobacteraceae bacterium]|nr:deoxyribonuclease IV [Bryobacteraceae bacterium]